MLLKSLLALSVSLIAIEGALAAPMLKADVLVNAAIVTVGDADPPGADADPPDTEPEVDDRASGVVRAVAAADAPCPSGDDAGLVGLWFEQAAAATNNTDATMTARLRPVGTFPHPVLSWTSDAGYRRNHRPAGSGPRPVTGPGGPPALAPPAAAVRPCSGRAGAAGVGRPPSPATKPAAG